MPRNLPVLATTEMLVPKAAVNEDDRAIARQRDVGSSRQVAAMQPETEAGSMEIVPNGDFRLGVATAYGRHDAAYGQGGRRAGMHSYLMTRQKVANSSVTPHPRFFGRFPPIGSSRSLN